jgi:hypothetical protein
MVNFMGLENIEIYHPTSNLNFSSNAPQSFPEIPE